MRESNCCCCSATAAGTHLDGGDVEVLVETDGRCVSGVNSVQLCLYVLNVLLKELHLQVKEG